MIKAQHDALTSVRLAADLCGVPIEQVLSMVARKVVRPVTIRGQRLVSLLEVERAIRREAAHDPSL